MTFDFLPNLINHPNIKSHYNTLVHSPIALVEDQDKFLALPIYSDIIFILISNIRRKKQQRSSHLANSINAFFSNYLDLCYLNCKTDSQFFQSHYLNSLYFYFGIDTSPKPITTACKDGTLLISDSPFSSPVFEKKNPLLNTKCSYLILVSPGEEVQSIQLDVLFRYDFNSKMFTSSATKTFVSVLDESLPICPHNQMEYINRLRSILKYGHIYANNIGNISDEFRESNEGIAIGISKRPGLNNAFTNNMLAKPSLLVNQYSDFLGNRTLSGYRDNNFNLTSKNSDKERVLILGGSSAFCGELPFEYTIENQLRKQTGLKDITCLAYPSEFLLHEYQKLIHWLVHREVPSHVFSFSLYNDFVLGYSMPDANRNTMAPLSLFGKCSGRVIKKNNLYHDTDLNYDDNFLANQISSLIKLIDLLAQEYNFTYVYIMQPYLFDFPEQVSLYYKYGLQNIINPDIGFSAFIRKRMENYNQFKSIILKRLKRTDLRNTSIVDGRDCLLESNNLDFIDLIHLNKNGTSRLASMMKSYL